MTKEVLQGRTGTVEDYSEAPTSPKNDGRQYLVFRLLTTLGENGVFYIDLTISDGPALAGLIVAAHARKLPVQIFYLTPDITPPVLPHDPGGFVCGARYA